MMKIGTMKMTNIMTETHTMTETDTIIGTDNDRDRYGDRDQFDDGDRFDDIDRFDDRDRFNDGVRFDDSDRYKDINKYEDEDLLVQIYSLKLDYKYVSDRVSRSDETNNQPMSRVRLDISDAHFRVDGETKERLTKQSMTADTG